MFWIWVCLGVGIDKRWNFNGCGDFCGEIFGGGNYIIEVGGGGLEVAQRVDFGGVSCGRAWVSSLPNFFSWKFLPILETTPISLHK